jgi:hypothetical protein
MRTIKLLCSQLRTRGHDTSYIARASTDSSKDHQKVSQGDRQALIRQKRRLGLNICMPMWLIVAINSVSEIPVQPVKPALGCHSLTSPDSINDSVTDILQHVRQRCQSWPQ